MYQCWSLWYHSIVPHLLALVIIIFIVIPCQPIPLFHFWQPFYQQPSNNSLNTLQPRVLNFFPVPVEEECLSEDKRRRGICMNTYECRIQQGKSHGPCALGFGVCCVFTATCGGEIGTNLTYITSPGFPNLIDKPLNCTFVIKKVEAQVSQLRIDFLHFNIGQPNRRSGICDEDVMEVISGDIIFHLCGWNSGQHIYVDVGDDPVFINFRLANNLQSKMWEMSVEQLAFEQRAPAGCLQYFDTPSGVLKTLNYLPNGRYLANQDYLLCIRQERGMCSIVYSPCSNDSFRIAPMRLNTTTSNNSNSTNTNEIPLDDEGSGTNPDDIITPITRCTDRVLIPCDFEEFITPGNDESAICDLEHCGQSLCSPNQLDMDGNCRIETSATPFHIRVAFGMQDTTPESSSFQDMVGMCLNYQQLPCIP